MMSVTAFEAATFYEYSRSKDNKDVSFPLNIVVIDSDNYSIGFCVCTKNGDIKTVSSKNLTDNTISIEDIDEVFCNKSKKYKSICDFEDENIEVFNEKMRLYYKSEKELNASFEDVLGLNMNCDEFENIFNVVNNKFSELLSSFDDLCKNAKFNEDGYSIIIIGNAIRFYPVRYYIKSILTFDPFLPDNRFLNEIYSDDVDAIVTIGEKGYEDKKNREQEIYIHLIDIENHKKEKIRIPFITNQTEEDENIFFGPIFISADDKLEFEVNNKLRLEELRDPLRISDIVVVEVGLCLNDDKYIIRVRKYKQPDRFFDVETI